MLSHPSSHKNRHFIVYQADKFHHLQLLLPVSLRHRLHPLSNRWSGIAVRAEAACLHQSAAVSDLLPVESCCWCQYSRGKWCRAEPCRVGGIPVGLVLLFVDLSMSDQLIGML